MNGIASRLLAALAYPRAASDYAELGSPFTSNERDVRARIVRVTHETHDTVTLHLRASAELRPHRAGQHVALGVEIDGVRRTRFFSIASGEGEPLAITVKARPNGEVTPRIVAETLDGADVVLSQPSGDFVLPSPLPARILLLSAGSGITPVMSMLRTLVAQGYTGSITFLHWARSAEDVIFARELERIASTELLRLAVITRFFDAQDLAREVPDFAEWDTWACGAAPFLDALGAHYASRAASERLRTERFSLGPIASDAAEAEVDFARSGRRAVGKGPILALAESAGLTPKSGCRMGICHTCVCRKISGTTRDLRSGEVQTDADVDIRICTSEPIGPVVLDL